MTEVPAHAAERLRTERTIWLATVAGDASPSVRPLWFVWEGDSILLYSQPGTAKIRHIERNPSVCLHLDPDDWGEDVVVVTGVARLAPERPPPDQGEYARKYAAGFEHLGMTPAEYAADYSVPIVVDVRRVLTY